MFRYWLIITLLMLVPLRALAWGELGHATVCQIAWLNLTPAAQQWLRPFYQEHNYNTFAQACNWADHIRSDDRFDHLKPLHYVNLPRSARHYASHLALCNRGACVTQAIEDYRRRLQRTPLGASESVLLLAHFVGDIHQPMHVSYADDLGGNRWHFAVPGSEDPVSLHWLWDTFLVTGLLNDLPEQERRKADSWRQLSIELNSTMNADERQQWQQSMTANAWAQESFSLTRSIYHDLSDQTVFDPQQAEAYKPIVRQRLQQAGVRLATLLNSLVPSASKP